jgi:hypothetical protein
MVVSQFEVQYAHASSELSGWGLSGQIYGVKGLHAR